MKTYTGKAKVKENTTWVYAGLILDIVGVYIEYKNGSGVGIYPDGARDYRLNYSMHEEIAKKLGYKSNTTVINSKDLEILELYQSIEFPLSNIETLDLIDFVKQNPHIEKENILPEFIKSETKESIPPIPDLSTLKSDEEWDKLHPTN